MNDLTVFIISSGTNPNYDDCLKALQLQSVKFKLEIIKDYHPLSVAFQEMLNRCQTTYYIECDEDMILYPNTIEKMYNNVVTTTENISMCCYQLKDVHADVIIYGIKIYKYNIFKNYPYNLDHMSCEVEQLEKMKVDGYTYKLIEEVVGDHSPKWTNSLIFERYFNLMEKFKQYKYDWLKSIPKKLWTLSLTNPSEQNFCALLGAYTSIVSDKKLITGEKDFSIEREEFLKIKSLFLNEKSVI